MMRIVSTGLDVPEPRYLAKVTCVVQQRLVGVVVVVVVGVFVQKSNSKSNFILKPMKVPQGNGESARY